MKNKKIKEPLYEKSNTNQLMINYKTYKMTASERMLYFALAFIVGAVVSYIFYGGIGKDDYGNATLLTYILDCSIMVIVGVVSGIVFIPIKTQQIIEARKNKLRKQFIDLLDSLSTSISAGKNTINAFISAKEDLLVQYQEDDYILQEVDNIIEGVRNGFDVGSMIKNFGKRSGIQDIVTFGRVFEISNTKGADSKDVIRNSHSIISSKCAIENEIETKVASNKNEQKIMLIMPVILVGMIKLTSADFAANFTTPTGIISTTIAIGIFVASYFIGKKILNIEV